MICGSGVWKRLNVFTLLEIFNEKINYQLLYALTHVGNGTYFSQHVFDETFVSVGKVTKNLFIFS